MFLLRNFLTIWEAEKNGPAGTADEFVEMHHNKSFMGINKKKEDGTDPVNIFSLNKGEISLDKPVAKRFKNWNSWKVSLGKKFIV